MSDVLVAGSCGFFTVSCISSHLIIAGDSAVVSFRGQHHIQICLVRPSLALIPGIESQG